MSDPTPAAPDPQPPLPKSRILVAPGGVCSVEFGFQYEDGYRVLVEFDGTCSKWHASLSGLPSNIGGSLAYGDTKLEALGALCCALAATIDCLNLPAGAAPDQAEGPQ